jgi:hypothetical protein
MIRLLLAFLGFWIASFFFFWSFGDWATAGNIGDSFGAVSALFSGAALAMAIYSMVLQQKQSSEFEKHTLKAEQRTIDVLEQQSRAIGLIEQSLQQQVHAGRVAALTFMIERQEKRVESYRDWGQKSHNNENHYKNGIEAAEKQIRAFEEQVKKLGATL